MATKKLTIRDVAKMLGVSYATVSRALSGSPGISEATRKRVMTTCEEVGYTTNHIARSLVIRESKLIGLILGNIDNPFIGRLASNTEIHARSRGYNLILCNSTSLKEQEVEVFSLLMGRQVDGIIIVPSSANSYGALEKYINQIPTVFVGENMKDSRVNYVAVDNFKGTYIGTEYLVSLGHRSIAYIGRRPDSVTHQLRGDGYIAVCREHGMDPYFIDNTLQPFSSTETGYVLAKKFFSASPKHTAIFAATDTIALGIIKAADELGISIPNDFSLIGFDNISFASLSRIDLTTINQPLPEMASTAVNMLIDMIQNPLASYSHQVLAPTLIKRGTCLAVNKKESEY